MKIIAHRGNLLGPDKKHENSPGKIKEALATGFDVEVDVWKLEKGNDWYLGHDGPKYKIDKSFIFEENQYGKILYCHAKNIQAFIDMNRPGMKNDVFYHHTDKFTLTRNKWIWAYPYPNVPDNPKIIIAVPEQFLPPDKFKTKYNKLGGVCTDYPLNY